MSALSSRNPFFKPRGELANFFFIIWQPFLQPTSLKQKLIITACLLVTTERWFPSPSPIRKVGRARFPDSNGSIERSKSEFLKRDLINMRTVLGEAMVMYRAVNVVLCWCQIWYRRAILQVSKSKKSALFMRQARKELISRVTVARFRVI